MRNLPLTFDCVYYSQKWWEDFAKFCGLLRIYELYQHAKNLVNSQCTLKSFETSKLHNKIDGTTIHYTAKLPLGPFRSRSAKVWRSVLCQNTKVHLIYGSFFMRLLSQCSAEVMSFAKLKGMSKSWLFYSTFLINYDTVCSQQKSWVSYRKLYEKSRKIQRSKVK